MIEVIKQIENKSKHDAHKKFLVRCSCGKEYVMNSQQIKRTTRCIECARKNNLKLGPTTRRKVFTIYKTKLYHVWIGMKNRCYNDNCSAYKNYGGRGIKVCEEWIKNPFRFYEWAIKNGYNNGLSIDRINNDGNYCPENCRWATRKEQANNIRKNHIIVYNDKTKTMSEWADFLGITYSQIKYRIKKYGICEKTFFAGRYNTNGKKL